MYDYILGLAKAVRSPRIAFTAALGSLFAIVLTLAFDCAKLAPDLLEKNLKVGETDKGGVDATIELLRTLAQHLSDLQVLSLSVVFSFSVSGVLVSCFMLIHDSLSVIFLALLTKLPIPDKYGILESAEVKGSLANLASIAVLVWLLAGISFGGAADALRLLLFFLLLIIVLVGMRRYFLDSKIDGKE